MQERSLDLGGLLELHPLAVSLAMAAGLALTIALAWLLPAGAGGAVFALGVVVFVLGWPFLVARHLEESFGEITELNQTFVTLSYISALVLLPIALAIIELFTGLGWSLVFLVAWGAGCVAAGYLLWVVNQALVIVEERRWIAPEQLVPSFLMMFVLPLTIPYMQHRLRRAMSEAREDEWTGG